MYPMEQKCSLWKVFQVFADEPMKIHYIKEIAKKIGLAPTSVKIHVQQLLSRHLISRKKGERFIGLIANRDNRDFLFYKSIANLINLKSSGMLDYLIETMYPQSLIVYGSYLKGEDIENSDIDIFILSKTRIALNTKQFEKYLKRSVHIILESDMKKLPVELKTNIVNGLVLYGYLGKVS